MLVHTGSVRELLTHFGDAIAGQVVRKLLEDIQYTEFFDNQIYVTSDYRSPTSSRDKRKNPILKRNRVTCNVAMTLNATNNRWITSKKKLVEGYVLSQKNNFDSVPIFFDNKDQIVMTEYLMPTMLTMTIRFEVLDKSLAYDLHNRAILAFTNGDTYTLADVVVDYPIPGETFNHILKLMRYKGIKANQYLSYLRDYSSKQISMNVSRTAPNRDAELVVRRQMANLYVAIDIPNDRPTVETMGTSAALNVVEMTVVTQFSRTSAVMTHFPPVINNMLVGEDLIPPYVKTAIKRTEQFRVFDTYAETHYLNSGENGTRLFPMYDLVKCPYYDPWSVPEASTTKSMGYVPFLSMIVLLDDPNIPSAVTKMDLVSGLAEYKLSADALFTLDKITSQALHPIHRYYVQVFVNNRQIAPESLTFDGRVLTIPNRDTSKTYHLVISKDENKFITQNGYGLWVPVTIPSTLNSKKRSASIANGAIFNSGNKATPYRPRSIPKRVSGKDQIATVITTPNTQGGTRMGGITLTTIDPLGVKHTISTTSDLVNGIVVNADGTVTGGTVADVRPTVTPTDYNPTTPGTGTTGGSYLSGTLAPDAYIGYNESLTYNGSMNYAGCNIFRVLDGEIVTSLAPN